MKKVCQWIAYLIMYCFLAKPGLAQVREKYRPEIHFSPRAHWINDPNGLVYYKGVYHLFFQYYPGASVWGPMHWGHATSMDLFHWKELKIALYPDSLGYIFSGSAVFDSLNTSGFGKNGLPPLVAIFTQHNAADEKLGSKTYQNQSLAYSNDAGLNWRKYMRNPVLKNPGITDFRDPKVFWYSPEKKWILTLATKNCVTFYSSPDLKTWAKESEFGQSIGAHGGVWECPDLFSLNLKGKQYWILIVNLNPGGPNIGSGTQYFIGSFDGSKFSAQDTLTRWLDYGPDEYAGITWSNTGTRKIFLGWMSNWLYAEKTPTGTWRNAMTIPRDLSLKSVGDLIFLSSEPVKELQKVQKTGINLKNINLEKEFKPLKLNAGAYVLRLSSAELKDYTITVSNSLNEHIVFGFDKTKNRYYMDRTKAGNVSFHKDFAGIFYAPRISQESKHDLTLVLDQSSIEGFADSGLSVLTSVMFPDKPFNSLTLNSPSKMNLETLSLNEVQ